MALRLADHKPGVVVESEGLDLVTGGCLSHLAYQHLPPLRRPGVAPLSV